MLSSRNKKSTIELIVSIILGSLGAFFAWLGFTLPSGIILIASAYGLLFYSDFFTEGLLSGIKACVVVIVFQAIWGMSKQYLNDYKKILITIITSLILIFFTNNTYQISLIIISGVLGNFLFREKTKAKQISLSIDYKPLFYLLLFLFSKSRIILLKIYSIFIEG